jgi:hypothetical protein
VVSKPFRTKVLVPGAVAVVAAVGITAAVGGSADGQTPTPTPLPQGSQLVTLDPANFTTTIDNPYLPLVPGSRWKYRALSPDGSIERGLVRVTGRTRLVAGVRAVVVRDTARTARGVKVEDTRDWYAQDREGNVWYLGENSRAFERGRPAGREGSWEAGVNGAQAGIAMPAQPTPGQTYRQEYYKGSAEDNGQVLEVGTPVTVAFGRFTDVVGTQDTNALRTFDVEHKFYARGVGLVLALGVAGDGEREELTSFKRGGSR